MVTFRFFHGTRKKCLPKSLSALAGILFASISLQAADFEVAGVFGASNSLPNFTSSLQSGLGSGVTVSESGFRWLVGGSVGFGVTSRFMVLAETNVNRAWNANIAFATGLGSGSFTESVYLADYTAGVHFMPLGRKKVSPYVAAAFGGVSQIVRATSSEIATVSATVNDLTYNAGGGIRYHIGPSWGLRPEVKWVHIPGENFFRYGVGVFWGSRQ